MAKAHGDPK